jgi:Tfp pilus assembly protein PilE
MDSIEYFIVGLLIGIAIHSYISYIKKERTRPNVLNLMTLY